MKSTIDLERFAKLPKWAREHIRNLDRKIDDQKCTIGKLRAQQEFGCTGRVKRGYFDDETKLPDRDTYYFQVTDDEYSTISVRIDDEGYLNINSLGRMLSVEPRASNAVHLRVRR